MGKDRKEYVCIKKCFWGKLYDLGDPLSFEGDHKMLKSFKVKKASDPIDEVVGDDEPTTLAGVEAKNAQDIIDSIDRESSGEGLAVSELAAGQAPVEGPPTSPAPDDETPVSGTPAEDFMK